MPTLAEAAHQTASRTLALLDRASERGSVAGAIARALAAGHTLFLLADPAQATVADQLVEGLRRRFGARHWPPLLIIRAANPQLALIGCGYDVANPLAHQAELLVRRGDVVLVLAGLEPSADLAAAARAAAARGAVVAGLGLPCRPRQAEAAGEPSPATAVVEADPAILLPEAPAEELLASQLALAQALTGQLAQLLPDEPPADVEPLLVAFGCSNCGAILTIPRHLAGRRGVCPDCLNNTILAPGVPEAANEKRSHLRFALRECSLRVALAAPNKPLVQLPGRVSLDNLSPGGLLFAIADSAIELQPNDRLQIELTTPAFQRPLFLQGIVRRVTREARVHRVGIIFQECPPATAERLRILERNLVLRHITRNAPPPPDEP